MSVSAPSRGKAFLFGLVALVIGVIVALILLEVGSTLYLTIKDHKFISAHDRYEAADHPWFQGIMSRPTSTYYCQHIYTLFPHPYLGWVYHGNPPCGYPKSINNIGLHRHDFPPPRYKDKYVVLFTGGSVAEYVGGGNQQYVGAGLHPPYLERSLNAHWVAPNGKPFLVLQAAAGGWKQPQQAIMVMLYADRVDAIVTLDGANEWNRAHIPVGERFEYPFLSFEQVNPLANEDFKTVVAQWVLANIVTFFRTTYPFNHSSAAFIVADRLDRIAEAEPQTSKHWRTTVQSIFAAPKDWTGHDYWTHGIQQYEKYIRDMHGMAQIYHDKEAYFLQPVIAVDKQLSPREQRIMTPEDLKSYHDSYIELTNDVLGLRKDGIPLYSILDVFENHPETIYADPVHSLWDDRLGEAPGYTLIANRMAAILAKAWHLKAKPHA